VVFERNPGISVPIAYPSPSFRHIMADSQILALYHHRNCNFNSNSCVVVFSVENFGLID